MKIKLIGNGHYEVVYKGKSIGRFDKYDLDTLNNAQVGVFLLDEILAYNPEWKSWIEEHPWCATTIEDFEGEVEYYIDKVDEEAPYSRDWKY